MKFQLLFKCICIVLVGMMSMFVFAEDEAEGEASTAVQSSYMQLKPTITTNYQSAGMKYVRADVAVRVESNMISNITAHKDPVRDLIIMLLSRQDKETLTSSDGLAALREEAKEEIVAFLESEGEPTGVLDVLFMSFLVE